MAYGNITFAAPRYSSKNLSGFWQRNAGNENAAAELAAKRDYWSGVLWKRGRSQYWIDALISEDIETLGDITWPVIIKIERSSSYEMLGKLGAAQLAALAGLGERPKWVPGHWSAT